MTDFTRDEWDDMQGADDESTFTNVECGCWLCGKGMTVDACCPPEEAICETCIMVGAP